ncbi:MAG: response regulator [Chloroflexi bacterium]|nr:response regulator [Chloroflexota bacterium]
MAIILIVEDVPESAQMAATILKRYGHEPLIADTGQRGLDLIEEKIPDLIIFDYMLPDLDAGDFIRQLRAQDSHAQIPLIACSASPRSLIEKSVGPTGFTDFIRKPYRVSFFMEVVERHAATSSR